jgi:hypothetical protein
MRVSSETATSRLEEVRRRRELWRRSRYGNVGRVPHELWRAAAEVARVHGVETMAARLELNSVRLRQWVERSQPVVPSTASLPAPTTAPQPPHSISLVELPPLFPKVPWPVFGASTDGTCSRHSAAHGALSSFLPRYSRTLAENSLNRQDSWGDSPGYGELGRWPS